MVVIELPRLGLLLKPPKEAITSSIVKELMQGHTGYTGRGIKVAVLDSGVNGSHPSLRGKLLSGIDMRGIGDPDDHYGHGTYVASIIAGSRLNTRYGMIEGMAPGARMVSIKVFDDDGNGESSWIADGLREAYRMDVDLVNLSGGGFTGTPEEKEAVDMLASRNIMVVAAIGNEGMDAINFPAGFGNAVAVGAMANGHKAGFSSVGPSNNGLIKPDIMAYGIDVVSAATGELDGWYDDVKDQVEPMSGTSVATPYVTGALAQVLEAAGRRLTRDEIESVLMASGGGRKNNYYGYGIMNVPRALEALKNIGSRRVSMKTSSGSGLLPAVASLAIGGALVWISGRR